MEAQKALNSQNYPDYPAKAVLSYFLLYSKIIIVKPAWYWYETRHTDQYNICENPDINTHTYSYMISDKNAKTYIGEKTKSLTNGVRKIGGFHGEG